MSFISYSQNFEDVLLWRALGRVPHGFYIDVGANDPVLHSVTKAFYDAGWHGINIEPMPSYRAPFEEQRPRDINLTCAAGAAAGEITLFDVPDMNGWASTDAAVAAAHREQGHSVVETRVPLRTLADICAEHVTGEIHFLKVDVEGFEGEVLKGMDFERWRPWIVVVEATVPGSRETNHETWEHLVTAHRYTFAWFDGLNRYYVADEHAELRAALTVQANVFDDFIPHHLDKALADVRSLSRERADAWKQLDALDAHAKDVEARYAKEQALFAEQQQRFTAEQERFLAERQRFVTEQERYAAEHQRFAGERQAWLTEQERLTAALASTEAYVETTLDAWRRATAESDRLQHALEAEVAQHQADNHAAHERATLLDEQLRRTDEWGRNLEQRLLAVYASTSWRITAPLRAIARRGENSLPNLARRKAKGALRRLLRWVTSREALRRALLPVIARSPRLQRYVASFLVAAKSATAQEAPVAADVPAQLRALPQSARTVLADLRAAYQNQGKH